MCQHAVLLSKSLPPLLTPIETANVLRVHINTIYRMCAGEKRDLESAMIRGHRRIYRDSLIAFLEEHDAGRYAQLETDKIAAIVDKAYREEHRGRGAAYQKCKSTGTR